MDIKHELEFLYQVPSSYGMPFGGPSPLLGTGTTLCTSERLGHAWGITQSRKASGYGPWTL